MESLFGRYRNLIILLGALFLQAMGLALQVRRTVDNEPTRLLRVWTVAAVTPFEKVIVWMQGSSHNIWHNYLYLRGVRAENRELKGEIERLKLEQVRLSEDAEQARRLQSLLAFKEQFISQTVPAQIIGSSGSEQSRSVYLDKGSSDGIKTDMAVITADGIVGKVLRVFHSTSLVLLIDDQSSGVGAILEKSRLQGVLRGTPAGEVILEKVMSDEQVQPGEQVLTSGGDRIFPKGLPVGTVTKVSQGRELFWNIRVRPAANLDKLEEVLVVTQVTEKSPLPVANGPVRAADILAQRLPSVPEKPPGPNAGADPTKPDATKKPGLLTPGTQAAQPGTPQNPKPKSAMSPPNLAQSPPVGPPGDAAAKSKPPIPPAANPAGTSSTGSSGSATPAAKTSSNTTGTVKPAAANPGAVKAAAPAVKTSNQPAAPPASQPAPTPSQDSPQ
jgi:rod shape-determining protein MreC